MRLPASLIFDMEQADTKHCVVEIFTKIFAEPSYKDYPYAGLALQATIGKRNEISRAPFLG